MQQQNNNNQQSQYRVRINKYIKAYEVRAIDSDGTNLGILKFFDALQLAQSQNLDLVQINNAMPPTCKILDYGKYLFDLKKQQKEQKKNQKVQEIKTIECRPNTEVYDLTYKAEHAKEFLKEGHRVKFVVKFKGRELSHLEIGKEKLDFLLDQVKDLVQTIPTAITEGKIMSVMVYPKK